MIEHWDTVAVAVAISLATVILFMAILYCVYSGRCPLCVRRKEAEDDHSSLSSTMSFAAFRSQQQPARKELLTTHPKFWDNVQKYMPPGTPRRESALSFDDSCSITSIDSTVGMGKVEMQIERDMRKKKLTVYITCISDLYCKSNRKIYLYITATNIEMKSLQGAEEMLPLKSPKDPPSGFLSTQDLETKRQLTLQQSESLDTIDEEGSIKTGDSKTGTPKAISEEDLTKITHDRQNGVSHQNGGPQTHGGISQNNNQENKGTKLTPPDVVSDKSPIAPKLTKSYFTFGREKKELPPEITSVVDTVMVKEYTTKQKYVKDEQIVFHEKFIMPITSHTEGLCFQLACLCQRRNQEDRVIRQGELVIPMPDPGLSYYTVQMMPLVKEPKGNVCISMTYLPTAEKLTLSINEVTGLLLPEPSVTNSDLYWRVVVTSRGSRLKRRTGLRSAASKDLSWENDSFTFDVPSAILENVAIVATLFQVVSVGSLEGLQPPQRVPSPMSPTGDTESEDGEEFKRLLVGQITLSKHTSDTVARDQWQTALVSPREHIKRWHFLR